MPKYNPLIFSGLDFTGGPSGAVQWNPPVATEADLPMAGNNSGEARVAIDTKKIFVWDSVNLKWVDTSLTIDSIGATPNADGMTLSFEEDRKSTRLNSSH